MVRRPAALLIAVYAATFAYLLVTPILPDVGGTSDTNTIVSDVTMFLLLGGCVMVWVPAQDEPFVLALLALGSGMLYAAFNEAGSIPLENITAVLFAATLGMLFAWALADPAVAIAVPLFVAGIDAASVFGGGPSELLARDTSALGDFISIYMPAWGGGRAGVLGIADLVLMAFFAAHAARFRMRRTVTTIALLLALPAALLLELQIDHPVPGITFLAAALLLPNLDLLPRMLAREDTG